VPAERGAEGARRAIADAFGDFGHAEVVAAEQVFCDGHAPGEQILGRPTACVKRSKNAERESAAVFAS
jgi:hypothetical protein